MKKLIISFLVIISNYGINLFSQQIYWQHLGGPFGGIVGDIGINSKGDIFAGVYTYWLVYFGLFKSTDNGETWISLNSFSNSEINAIYITKNDHIWVGTFREDRIYLSTDDGNTWIARGKGFIAPACWAFGESKDGVLFAGSGQFVSTFRSTDYGETWQLSGNLGSLCFATDSNNIIYTGTLSGLYFSTDNGLSWSFNTSLGSIPISSILIDSSNNIYCGTGYYFDNGNGVYFSSNQGQTWTHIGLSGKIINALAKDSKGKIYAGTLRDGLFITTNNGIDWLQYKEGLHRKDILRIKINNKDDIFIGSEGIGPTIYHANSGGGGVFRLLDGGKSFEQVGLPISYVTNIVFSGDSLIFAATPSGVQKYNRITRKWKNVGLHQVEAISITPSNYLYAISLYDGLYKSTNFGESWTMTNLTQDSLFSIFNVLAINDDTVFAATDGRLMRSTNGGLNWVRLTALTSSFSSGIKYNNDTLYVAGSNFYISNDLGSNFHKLDYMFDAATKASIAVTQNYVFALNMYPQVGIYRKPKWSNVFEKVFHKRATVIFCTRNNLLITDVVNSNNIFDSIYISTNNGNTWIGLKKPALRYFYLTEINEDYNQNLFFGTTRLGLYEVTLITSVEEEKKKFSFELYQNYPNPFNPTTKIRYSLKENCLVNLKVYDLLGREIAVLVKEPQDEGLYEVEFDASKYNLNSGIYFYQLRAGKYKSVRKFTLIK